MRLILGAFALAVCLSPLANAEEIKYPLSGANTKINWTGSKPEGKHTGGFKKLSGTAMTSNGELKLEVEIDCQSLFSDDEKLTQHLMSPDFFSVKEHPKAMFKSTGVAQSKEGATITGELTLLGKTKKISFPAEIKAGESLAIKSKFKINRMEFGMTYGKGKVDDEVEIQMEVNAKK